MSTNRAPINNNSKISLRRHSKVYSPSEDTFLLSDNLKVSNSDLVLEIGVGSGYISILAAQRAKYVWGTDINPYAVILSTRNAVLNDVGNVNFVITDLFPDINKKFDLIIFNPPYLPEEEGLINEKKEIDKSWGSGKNGRRVTNRFIKELKDYLKRDGLAQVVQSSLTGVEKTINNFKEEGFHVRRAAERKLFFEKLFLLDVAQ